VDSINIWDSGEHKYMGQWIAYRYGRVVSIQIWNSGQHTDMEQWTAYRYGTVSSIQIWDSGHKDAARSELVQDSVTWRAVVYYNHLVQP
jgi:hypothetical protein